MKKLLIFFAVTSSIWVFLFMLAPAQTMAFFGNFETDVVGLHMTRNLGAAHYVQWCAWDAAIV